MYSKNKKQLQSVLPKKEKGVKTKRNESDDEYCPSNPPKKKGKKKVSKKKINSLGEQGEQKKLTCRKCLEEFDNRKSLYDHGKTHQNDKQEEQPKHTFRFDEQLEMYFCNTCMEEYQSKEEVESHIAKSHSENFICETCNAVCDSVYAFAIHLKTHTEGDTYSCPLCTYTCIRRAGLLTHINRVHYHKFYYYCKQCGKGFNDGVLYREHENEHLGIKPFVCVVCNKEFVFSRYLLVHQVRHHTVHIEGILHKTQCSICMKVFSKVTTLLKHITTKHNPNEEPNDRKHLCDMCGKGFGSSDKLKIHYRVHTGDKPFSCNFCEKSFTKKDYLVMHERVHTGEKPYSCEYCGKCFNQASSLRIHVRGHTGERPYICNFCSVGYISRGSLNLHMKICNGTIDQN